MTLQIHHKRLARICLTHLQERLALNHISIVDQDINWPKLGLRKHSCFSDVLPVYEVALYELDVLINSISPLGLDALTLRHPLRLLQTLLINIEHGQLCALLRQSDGHVPAEAIGGARDQHVLPFQLGLSKPALVLSEQREQVQDNEQDHPVGLPLDTAILLESPL